MNFKNSDMRPYDMSVMPCRQNALLLPLIWAVCRVMTFGRLKIERSDMDGLRPPFLVLSCHQGFPDYYITPLALFPHRANYVSDVEGFAAFGRRLYRRIGCIPVRRYAGDIALIRSICHSVKKRGIVVIYPEARHSIAGTNAHLPESVGKLVKLLNLPVVTQKLYGSYLSQPVWDEGRNRKVPMRCVLEKALDPAEIKNTSEAEITALLNERFQYDEYRWQREQHIKIEYQNRTEGLHKVLYQCHNCGAEHAMKSSGCILECGNCGKSWCMDEYGRMKSDGMFINVPEWYEFQRREVERLIENGEYSLDIKVLVEALPNEKGFAPLGQGRLEQNPEGFTLTLEDGKALRFPSNALPSVHIEYNYRGRGDCAVLSTHNCCYYLYPINCDCSVTKIMLAGEVFYERGRKTCGKF